MAKTLVKCKYCRTQMAVGVNHHCAAMQRQGMHEKKADADDDMFEIAEEVTETLLTKIGRHFGTRGSSHTDTDTDTASDSGDFDSDD
jgi:predicted Zn-dependent protease with MMP-like domain